MALADFKAAYQSLNVNCLAVHNYGGSDIAAGLAVLLDTTNVMSDTNGLPGIVLPTNAGGAVGQLGVTIETIKAGGEGRVQVYGVAVGTAFNSITCGVRVRAADTTAHLGQIKACSSGEPQLGIALGTVADGDPVQVLLFQANNGLSGHVRQLA